MLSLPIRDEELEASITSNGFSLVDLNNLEASVLPEVTLEPSPAPGSSAAAEGDAAPARELSVTEAAPPPDESWVLINVGPPPASPVLGAAARGGPQEGTTAHNAAPATAGFSSLPANATRADRQRLAASGTSCAPLDEWMLQRMIDDEMPPFVMVSGKRTFVLWQTDICLASSPRASAICSYAHLLLRSPAPTLICSNPPLKRLDCCAVAQFRTKCST